MTGGESYVTAVGSNLIVIEGAASLEVPAVAAAVCPLIFPLTLGGSLNGSPRRMLWPWKVVLWQWLLLFRRQRMRRELMLLT